MTLTELYEHIAVSLWLKPATLEELATCEFLKYRSIATIDRLLMQLEKEGWIYCRGKRFFTYKATVVTLDKYEL